MTRHRIRRTKLQQFKTASIEISFIMFLFYANLLMGGVYAVDQGEAHGSVCAAGCDHAREFYDWNCCCVPGARDLRVSAAEIVGRDSPGEREMP